MSQKATRVLITLSFLLLVGIVSTQIYWVRKAYELRERLFVQTVAKALGEVGRRVAQPQKGRPVKVQVVPVSSAHYLVNLDAPINAQKLPFYLSAELEIHQVLTDYEYGVYDDRAKHIIYDNSARSGPHRALPTTKVAPSANSPYYFIVRFPNQVQYLRQQLDNWILVSITVLLFTLLFMYLFYQLIRQKSRTEAQRDFINNMTHELQTPIASIKVAADVLASPKIMEQPERMRKYVRMVQEETMRLQQQVETVLTVARSENNDGFKLQLIPIDIHELLFHLAERHGDYLHLELDAQHSVIRADQMHLINVMGNLVDNAVKYSPNNPVIRLMTHNENGQLVVIVQDNGIGIAPEHQSRVFTAYYRAPGANAASVKGFGLGLSYVQKIVKAHHWKITLTSAPGQGSTFCIRIPQQITHTQKELKVKSEE